jgi:phosphatidylglycerol---prolipoprotein diacylglyceryl transferase
VSGPIASLASVGWPVLDRVELPGNFSISPHGVGIAVGVLVGSWFVLRTGPRFRVVPDHLSSMLFVAVIGAVVGARFFYVVGHYGEFDGIGDMLAIWEGGISLIGGIAGAVLAAIPLMRRYGYRFFQVMDCAYLGFPMGIAVGRIGDLMIGDHLGKPTSWLLAWTYEGGTLAPPYDCVGGTCIARLFGGKTIEIARQGAEMFGANGRPLADGVGVHQTAMYDLLSCLVLFGVLLWFGRRRRREGVLILTFAIWYGAMRVITDFLRVDKTFAGLTGSQWTTATVATLSVLTLLWWAIRKPADPGAAPPTGAAAAWATDAPSTAFTPPAEPRG